MGLFVRIVFLLSLFVLLDPLGVRAETGPSHCAIGNETPGPLLRFSPLKGPVANPERGFSWPLELLDATDSLIRSGRSLALLGRIVLAIRTGERGARAIGHRHSAGTGVGAASHKRVEQLLDWIRRHLHREIRAEDAARILHVTPAAFSRAFKRLVGKPFTLYVNDLRVAEACLALGRSDRPIAQIATQCGFGTLSNFNQQFRRRLDMTPRTYRNGHLAAMDSVGARTTRKR